MGRGRRDRLALKTRAGGKVSGVQERLSSVYPRPVGVWAYSWVRRMSTTSRPGLEHPGHLLDGLPPALGAGDVVNGQSECYDVCAGCGNGQWAGVYRDEAYPSDEGQG